MKFVIFGIRTTLVRRLGTFRGWLSLLLIPVLVLTLNRALPARELTAPVQVGVCLPETGGEEFWELLQQRSGTVLTFLRATETEIEARVAAGQWDCGLVLPADFESRLGELKLNGLFTLCTGPASAVYPLVRETVSACVAQLVSPTMAWEYLQESGLAAGIDDPDAARQRLNQVLADSDRVLVAMTTPGGEPLEALELADSGIRDLLCWLVSCLVLIWMLLGATELGSWIVSPGAARMGSVRGRTSRMLIRIGPEALLAAFSGGLTLVLLGFGPVAWMALGAYVLFWSAAAVLLARFPALTGVLPVVMPFAAAASLLCCGILTAQAPWMRWLPVGLLLSGCGGDLKAVLMLSAAGAVLLGSAVVADHMK